MTNSPHNIYALEGHEGIDCCEDPTPAQCYHNCQKLSGDGDDEVDYTVRVWDIHRGICLRVLNIGTVDLVEYRSQNSNYAYQPCVVAFAPDGVRLATCMREGEKDAPVRVWDMTSDKDWLVLHHETEVSSVMFAPDGQYLVSVARFEKNCTSVEC